jgi:hypothetical protein
VEWSLWASVELSVSVAPAAASAGSDDDERVALVAMSPNGLSLCGREFTTPGPIASMLVAVLDGTGACRWARQFDVSAGEVLAKTVDADGSVVLAMALYDTFTIDGQSIGEPARRSEVVLRLGPDGALAWVQPVPCRSSLYDQIPANYPATGPLAGSEAGDVYVLIRYDGACTIGGHALPTSTHDYVGILKLARADGSALWGRGVAIDSPTRTLTFEDLAVAPDGNVYIAGRGGPSDFGQGLRFGGGGFVLALDRDGANRWLQPVAGADQISATTPGRVRVGTLAYQDDGPASELAPNGVGKSWFDLAELDAGTGQERWVKRLVTGGYWMGDLDSDALGRTVCSSIVWDDATLAGEPVPASSAGFWASLIALDAERRVMWTHTLLPQNQNAFSFVQMELTPSGKLFVAGPCRGECGITGGSTSERHFLARMRL